MVAYSDLIGGLISKFCGYKNYLEYKNIKFY